MSRAIVIKKWIIIDNIEMDMIVRVNLGFFYEFDQITALADSAALAVEESPLHASKP